MGQLISAVASTTPTDLTELARAIARSSLDPSVPALPRSAAAVFAEQMVVDVASMTAAVRCVAAFAELGARAPAFVLAVWTEDMMIRLGAAWREMFGEEWGPVLDFCRDTAVLGRPTNAFSSRWRNCRALDPVTSELVRLRWVRAHNGRLCQLCRTRARSIRQDGVICSISALILATSPIGQASAL